MDNFFAISIQIELAIHNIAKFKTMKLSLYLSLQSSSLVVMIGILILNVNSHTNTKTNRAASHPFRDLLGKHETTTKRRMTEDIVANSTKENDHIENIYIDDGTYAYDNQHYYVDSYPQPQQQHFTSLPNVVEEHEPSSIETKSTIVIDHDDDHGAMEASHVQTDQSHVHPHNMHMQAPHPLEPMGSLSNSRLGQPKSQHQSFVNQKSSTDNNGCTGKCDKWCDIRSSPSITGCCNNRCDDGCCKCSCRCCNGDCCCNGCPSDCGTCDCDC